MATKTWFKKLWREWRGFVVFAISLLFFRSAIADWFLVPSGSMEPTILIGDHVLTNRLAYDAKLPFTNISLAHLDDPQRGDIVVFDSPRDGTRLIKRLIGLPGDVIELRANHLIVNGEQASYTPLSAEQVAELGEHLAPNQLAFEEQLGGLSHPVFVSDHRANTYASFGPVQVPAEHYLMLGDNRDNSGDSRVFGFVSRHLLIGRSDTVLASLDADHYYLPRGDRFLHHMP